jgi:hypothetical protein
MPAQGTGWVLDFKADVGCSWLVYGLIVGKIRIEEELARSAFYFLHTRAGPLAKK